MATIKSPERIELERERRIVERERTRQRNRERYNKTITRVSFGGARKVNTPRYTVTAAREAAEMGYGDRDYWDYLEESGLEKHKWYSDKGLQIQADSMLTRSLSEALAGNEGD